MGYRVVCVESMTIYSAVLIGCQRVTDGQTDGRTDGRTDVKPIAITCFSIDDARKNGGSFFSDTVYVYYWSTSQQVNAILLLVHPFVHLWTCL